MPDETDFVYLFRSNSNLRPSDLSPFSFFLLRALDFISAFRKHSQMSVASLSFQSKIKSEIRPNKCLRMAKVCLFLPSTGLCTPTPREKLNPTMFSVLHQKHKMRENHLTCARAPALKFYLEKQVEANLLKDKEITKSVGEW